MNHTMDLFSLASLVTTLAVIIAYLNFRFIRMQTTIAIMSGSLLLSLIMLVLEHTGLSQLEEQAAQLVAKTDFHELLLKGMLSFLLFAGAMTVDFRTLKSEKWQVGTLSTVSTIASTLLVGTAVYYLLPFLNLHLNYAYCLLFGALISPTDPIAVLATFKELKAPKQIAVCLAGESLFNDGVGIVLFTTFYQLAFTTHHNIGPNHVLALFLKQAVGGIIYGYGLGFIARWLIKSNQNKQMAILLTLAVVTGGYSLALNLDISGPLAMVVAGLMIGNYLRQPTASKEIVQTLEVFWEVVDEVLNAILFLLIGFELLNVPLNHWMIIAAVLAIGLVLLVRFITVTVPLKFFAGFGKKQPPYMVSILTWGGLRGGLAVALALSLPSGTERDIILALTYGIVAFAIIIQGTSVRRLVNKARAANPSADPFHGA